MKFTTNYANKRPSQEPFEGGPSKTIPGDAMTISEIFARHASGLDTRKLHRFGIWDSDDTDLNDQVLSSPFHDRADLFQQLTVAMEQKDRIVKAIELEKALKDKGVIEDHEEPSLPPSNPTPTGDGGEKSS